MTTVLNLNLDVNRCLSGLWAWLRLSMPKSGIKKLDKKMTRLGVKRDDVKNQIDKAEREGKIPTNEVNQWLREVEKLEQDFESMKNKKRKLSNCCSIVRRVKTMLDEANELMRQAGALNPIATVGPLEPPMMFDISRRPPVGIGLYVKKIVSYIDGGEGNIISIYGMGGIGKTTVLESIRQHYLLKHPTTFDHVIWVVASKDCQLKRLQMDIAKSLSLKTLQENDDEQTCGDKLFKYLKNKNCLLLLDDIWGHLDLQLLGMAHPVIEPGQQQLHKVVVLTTRSETVCEQMETEKKIKVKCLDQDQAWQLFEQNSDKQFLGSDGGINFVAQELAKECAGLPLALITVARAMSRKKSWETWNDALHRIRDKHEWASIGLSEDSLLVYKAFKLSYDNLENDSIRECLLCCALWPEDYEIDKFYELIPCWIGCGIIREFNVINEAFNKGFSHLEDLMDASLLEHSSRGFVKMHDVIRDMALLIVSGLEENRRKWIVKAGIGLSHLPRQEEWQDAERASFMNNNITSLQDYGASTFPKLFMLILGGNGNLITIPPSLFASMYHLTYLDLGCCDITELPMEISCLTELRYLNLSYNPITTLPAEFGCLGKLEYLLLLNTKLETVPNGTISNLSMLRLLDIRDIYPIPKWWCDELKYFKGHHQLSVGIGIHATTDNIERLNMLPNVFIWKLVINGKKVSELPNFDLDTTQWSCNVSDNLEHLSIAHVTLDKLMFAAGVSHQSSFERLKILELFSLHLLENILLNGVVLRNLRELYIFQCWKLKDISWIQHLSCLILVEIGDCPEMKSLISDVGNSHSSTSSNIQSLTVSVMENLNCIANPPFHFPYLEHIDVMDCSKLKKLPFETEISKSRLKKIEGDQIWWDDLEWKDESIKNFLAPKFIPLDGQARLRKWFDHRRMRFIATILSNG